MPIYAYRCADCGHEKDVLQKLSDAPLTQCPACGKDTFSKQVTAAGFQLKGSGWYVTDFRGGKSNAGNKSNAAASDASAAKSDDAASAGSGNSNSSDSATPASTPSSSDAAKPAAGASASSSAA
ncbi:MULTISPECIES: FmdB family zinc ribbon protein [unclassified Caballeronia]|uniref:FmdB family zinc ribbon protein n=1 Tax=unclassified Caballeronia TaxID=2646786 RepID=UPI002028139B|nr:MULTISPECIES: FmdB family zinc ribbon protein [unclassified Caballeronia]MDR5764114.1 zinc ribbon domain-containing protein [Caballeronia sp. LZ028]MDR5785635.1 zinc ribbon domain-containing protein [Caballeronia sp. LP003]